MAHTMSVMAQLPPEMGGASGKVRLKSIASCIDSCEPITQVAYIDTEGL